MKQYQVFANYSIGLPESMRNILHSRWPSPSWPISLRSRRRLAGGGSWPVCRPYCDRFADRSAYQPTRSSPSDNDSGLPVSTVNKRTLETQSTGYQFTLVSYGNNNRMLIISSNFRGTCSVPSYEENRPF